MTSRPWWPYALPFGIYMAFLSLESLGGDLLWLYPLKTIFVAFALWWYKDQYDGLTPSFSFLSILVGVVAIVVWIAIDPFYPGQKEITSGSAPPPFDPRSLGDGAQWWVFMIFRVVGHVAVVPVMEELFWRSFLIRWIVNKNFKQVPHGTFTWGSFLITVGFFGIEHDQWLAGIICGVLYNLLLYKTKSVFSCVVAHAVSNGVLAIWVITQGDWKFW